MEQLTTWTYFLFRLCMPSLSVLSPAVIEVGGIEERAGEALKKAVIPVSAALWAEWP